MASYFVLLLLIIIGVGDTRRSIKLHKKNLDVVFLNEFSVNITGYTVNFDINGADPA